MSTALDQTNYTHDHSADTPAPPPKEVTYPVNLTLLEVHDSYIRHALIHCLGNVTHTAKSLGISTRTLQRWMKKTGTL